MFAVIQSGGKQYKVEKGSLLKVEFLDAEVGDSVSIDDVRLVADGSNLVCTEDKLSGASVAAKVTRQFKGPKVIVFKKKRRQGYQRKTGHRQLITEIEVTDIKKG